MVQGEPLRKAPSDSDYSIVIEIDGEQLCDPIPITIGPLLTELDFSPEIHKQKKVDPYSNTVDVRWDIHWPWEEDEEGYGLKIIYDLEDDVKDLEFAFENASNGNGDMGGTHSLVVDPEYMEKVAWWNPSNYEVKWEGFDSSIADEKAHRIYKYPDESEKNGDGVSPSRTIKEGKYLHKVELKHKTDDEQIQKYEIKFEVEYEVE